MTDFRLMRGEGWVRCCICGTLHEAPFDDLAVDGDGDKWDVCAGECARDSGIIDARPL